MRSRAARRCGKSPRPRERLIQCADSQQPEYRDRPRTGTTPNVSTGLEVEADSPMVIH